MRALVGLLASTLLACGTPARVSSTAVAPVGVTDADSGETDAGPVELDQGLSTDPSDAPGPQLDVSVAKPDVSPIDAQQPPDSVDADSDATDAPWWSSIPTCTRTCTTAADCPYANSPAYDTDNYACTKGLCVYTGCNSDAECQQSMGAKGFACREQAGVKSCMATCTQASECAIASPAFDADNYACSGGVCTYLGCHTDAECAASSPGTVCTKAWGSPTAYCLQACGKPADCASPVAGYDASHFACDGGLCRYLGCAGDAECQQLLQQPGAVCH